VAPENRSTPRALAPEERIAAEVVRRFGLVPPIEFGPVLERFADCAEAEIPGSCDGLVVGLHGPGPRPLILLQRWQAERRRRFTLAHELAHVLIPWHVGDAFLCETREVVELDYRGEPVESEPEANRFAAELLVPSTWLDKQVATLGADQVTPLLRTLEEARVSSYVACLRLRMVLPAGYVFAIEQQGVIRMCGQTDGTRVLPHNRDDIDLARFNTWAHSVETMAYGPTTVTWWVFRGHAPVAEYTRDPRTWREVLTGLLDRHAPHQPERGKVQQTLNGVIASAHGEARQEGNTEAGALYVRFRGRFAKARPLPESLLLDPDFEVLLHKRAEEFASPKN
jgi:hypothetical protein